MSTVRSWNNVWLYAKGEYQESSDTMDDLKKVVMAHTGCEPRAIDIASILRDEVLEHISSHTTPAHIKQALKHFLDFMTPYSFGIDGRSHIQVQIEACLSYMRLRVKRLPDDSCSFILGDIGQPDESILPLHQAESVEALNVVAK